VNLLGASTEKNETARVGANGVAHPPGFLEYSAKHSSSLGTNFNAQEGSWKVAFYFVIKRTTDIVASVVGLIFLSPLLLIVAIMVKLDGCGPVFFTQERWGRAGRRIKVLKFRTMNMAECDKAGTKQAIVNDPRISRIGVVLRKTNIDELPQLLNVIRGDMSLVGPRCHPIDMLAGGMPYEKLVPNYHDRHQVRPGMTGLAQVSGYRGPTVDVVSAKTRIELDLKYIQNMSVWLDIWIVFRTVKQELHDGSGT